MMKILRLFYHALICLLPIGASSAYYQSQKQMLPTFTHSNQLSIQQLTTNYKRSSSTFRKLPILYAGNQQQQHFELEAVDRSASLTKSYYLIQSPGVIKKTLISLILITAMKNLVSVLKINAISSLQFRSNKLIQTLLPFLASACCAGQLIINILFTGASCAGFNKFFGPIRPILLAWLILSTAKSQVRLSSKALVATVLSWSIAVMPEIIHWLNLRYLQNYKFGKRTIKTNQSLQTSIIHLQVPGMGCVACVNKVINSLKNTLFTTDNTQIIDTQSWLTDNSQGGMARVEVIHDDKQLLDELVLSIVTALKESGFDCKVL